MTKTPKRPRDPAQLAKFIVDVATGEIEDRRAHGTEKKKRPLKPAKKAVRRERGP